MVNATRGSLGLLFLLGSLTPRPASAQDVTLELAVGGLAFPVFVAGTQIPGDARLFIVERGGQIRVFQGGSVLPTPFLDFVPCSDPDCVDGEGEGGLLGLVFSPDYASDGTFYVYYTSGDPGIANDLVSRLSRFQVLGNPLTSNVADASSEVILFSAVQPAAGNHKGGTVAISDGFLYLALGDGGPSNNSQVDSTPLGKLLRFDLSLPSPPPRVVAEGLRNPFRFSFDPATGDLYLGDVGAGAFEEVDVVAAADLSDVALGSPAPINFGWDPMEGPACGSPSAGEPPCNDPSLFLPTHSYPHTPTVFGIIGGVVYRGSIASIQGEYFFGDISAQEYGSFVWNSTQGIVGGVQDRDSDFAPAAINSLVGIGTDSAGEVYFVDIGSTPSNGEIYRLVALEGTILIEGTAQGGTVTAVIDGEMVQITTLNGQSSATVVGNLVAAINADPQLGLLGVSASAVGDTVVVDGVTQSNISFGTTDPGLTLAIPALLVWGVVALALLMARAVRRRTRLAA